MKELGIGIIGTGWVSGEYIRAFEANPHTEVLGLVSRDMARAKAKAQEFNAPRCHAYDRVDEMLADSSIHIVVICTPHHLHVTQGIAAAQAGKHLVLEKPVALDLEGLRKLQAAVRSAQVKTVVSFVLRWNPLFEMIKVFLADGLLGNLFLAEVDYLHGIGPWYAQYEWNTKKEIAGSDLLTAGCHAVDGLRWFVGARPVEVFAYGNVSRQNPLQYEYEPNSLTLVKFADGTMGKVASSIECVQPYIFNVALFGDHGTIRNNQIFSKHWAGQKGWASFPTIMPDSGDVSHHPFSEEVRHFVDCILNDRESHANLEDAALTHEICFASQISAREKRPVRLPL
ncbi:MAG: Gfo/Idh/MocA family oxidoreductase [Terriglobia bacterium]|jgi:predicted dehydrogenase